MVHPNADGSTATIAGTLTCEVSVSSFFFSMSCAWIRCSSPSPMDFSVSLSRSVGESRANMTTLSWGRNCDDSSRLVSVAAFHSAHALLHAVDIG